MNTRIPMAVAAGLAIVAAIATASAFVMWPRASSSEDSRVASLDVTGDDTVPPIAARIVAGAVRVQSTSPSDVADRLGIAPTRIVVQGLEIDMPVAAYGLESDGSMALPDESVTAAWYRYGGVPGDGGRASLIAAHVASEVGGRGQFSYLRDVQVGEEVTVTLSDGSEKVFLVTRLEQISKQTVDFDAISQDSAGMLILVTCGGSWNPSIRHYDDNVVVWATPTQA